MNQSMRILVESALRLWQQVTGIDPDAESMSISDWSLRGTFNELQEALDLDASQVTAILLLAFFTEEYLKERSFNLHELLTQPDTVSARLELPKALLSLLGQAQVLAVRAEFIDSLKEGLKAYGIDTRPDMRELLEQPHELALLRRDALRSMAHLKVEQFLQGEHEKQGTKPTYIKTVHQWWNVNSMLDSAMRMPSGVSLNLIRHPEIMQSFFCFLIRNGSNVFVVTDIEPQAHPLQGQMSRRPDRTFNKRAQRNWFPYGLLDIEYNEESKRLYQAEVSQRALVVHQASALPLKPVVDLSPHEVVWTTMMFDLLVEKFWLKGWQAPQLSYTAEMLKSTAFLERAKSSDNLPALNYSPLALEPLSRDDVANATESELGDKCNNLNEWLEKRYGHLVPEETFNMVMLPEKELFLEDSGRITEDGKKYRNMAFFEKESFLERRIPLTHMDATRFGTREQLDADRKFIARVNYARSIDALAAKEYSERKKEVREWFSARVEANFEQVLSWANCSDLWMDEGMGGSFSGYHNDVGPVHHGCRNFILRSDIHKRADELRYYRQIRLRQTDSEATKCALTGAKASHFVAFLPGTAHELALLAGCQVAELPDVLQHWSLARPYTGNSILNRIDPMIWNVEDPWRALSLQVAIPLSKRGLAQVLKMPVVEPPLLNRCKKPT